MLFMIYSSMRGGGDVLSDGVIFGYCADFDECRFLRYYLLWPVLCLSISVKKTIRQK